MEIMDSHKIVTEDSYGRCKFTIEVSPSSNSIKFTLKEENYLYAYIIGDFNYWQKNEEHKLIWQLDPNDGILKMIKILEFESNLPNGEYSFEYILVDIEGTELTFQEYTKGTKKLSFKWSNINETLKIITSNDYIRPEFPLEFICIKDTSVADFSVEDVEWSISPSSNCIKQINNSIVLSSKNIDCKEITITANHKLKNLKCSKVIKVDTTSIAGAMIHYFRHDSCYNGSNHNWNIWAYEDGKDSKELYFSEDTDIGKSVVTDYKNIIIRKKIWGDNWVNEWNEQLPSVTLNHSKKNIYIINDNPNILFNLKDAIEATKPKFKYAIMDSSNRIKIKLSHEPLLGTKFELFINGNKAIKTTSIVKDKQREVILTNLPKTIIPSDLLEIRANKMFAPFEVLKRAFLDSFYYSGNDMGVTFSNTKIFLRLWAPTAYKVELLIYNSCKIDINNPSKVILLSSEYTNGTHFTSISRFSNEFKFYLYKLYFKSLSQNSKIIDKITYAVDPYAKSASVNGKRGVLIDLGSIRAKPQGYRNDSRPKLLSKEDSIIYEMHIRDFTIDKNSGVKDKLKGTYLGAVEKGTFYTDTNSNTVVKTGLDHLVELGITHIHLLPIFDFVSVDESKASGDNNRNWGYDPQNFNLPEGSYSTNPYNPMTRVKELREMVYSFHKAGIRVIMDMVYNHMASTENMDKIVPKYYFRTDYKGAYTNGSGCGNEMSSEKPMVRKFIVDSCLNWIQNYNIDGLRFDLMELIDIDTIKEITKKVSDIDPTILVYGEPWKGGDSPIKNGTYKGSQRNENFAIFNDTFRNAIRGNNNPGCGYVNGDQHNPSKCWTIIEGLKGSIFTLSSEPKESINYFDAHDNYTLWDQVEKSQNPAIVSGQYRECIDGAILDNKYVRQNILAAAILLTSQGIPFMQGGAEILRTKQGDHNSYKSNDAINEFNWSDKAKYLPVFNYFKALINLRKAHPSFRMKYSEDIKNKINIYFANGDDRSGVIFYHIKETVPNDSWNEILVVFNGTTIDNYNINSLIPTPRAGQWRVYLEGINISIDETDNFKIPLMKSHSIIVLYS